MGFNPNPKLIKVSDADASIPHPVRQVLADSPCPRFRGGASVAKNHAAQIIPEASNVFRVGGCAVTLGKFKELSLFALLGVDPLFHEFNNDPVGAKASLLRQAAHMPRRVCRKAHGLANNFVRSRHYTIIHQNGDARSSALGASVRGPVLQVRGFLLSIGDKQQTLKPGLLEPATTAPPFLSPKGATHHSPGQRPGDHGALTAPSPERAHHCFAPSGLARINGSSC